MGKQGAARAAPIAARDEPSRKDPPLERIAAVKMNLVVNPVAALTDAEWAAIARLRRIYKVGGEEALEKALDESRKDSIKYVRLIAELSHEARKWTRGRGKRRRLNAFHFVVARTANSRHEPARRFD